MNYFLVFRHLGWFLLLITAIMVISVGTASAIPSPAGHSDELALRGWGISIAITGAFSIFLLVLTRKASEGDLLRKEGMSIVGLGWVICSFFAALPYYFCDLELGFFKSLFEAVSGLTTTGATVLEDLTAVPKTILLWRSFTQWIGGLGILGMFVVISSSFGVGGKNLFLTESSIKSNEITGSSIKHFAHRLWALYIILTIVCALGLWVSEMTVFQAINHALTTVSTAGFGTENDSITGFTMWTKLWMVLFMFYCSISFPLHLAFFHKPSLDLFKHEETRTFFIILASAVTFILAGRLLLNNGAEETVIETGVETLFNVTSIATTTGFVSGDYETWPPFGKGLLLLLMVCGGCAGSTAGGLKVSRLILWWKITRTEIQRIYRPNLVQSLRLNGRSLPDGMREQLFVIFTTAIAACAIGTYALILLEPHLSTKGCFSAIVACLSNMGPAFGEFGPTQNFSIVSEPSMALMVILMILGRLEYTALLVLLSRKLWQKY